MAVLLPALNVHAQSALSGKITETEGDSPVYMAAIYIPDLQRGCLSDSTGHYSLTKIPNGTYKVQYSYLGYQTEIRSIVFDGSTREMNVEMQPSVVETHEIVVTAGYASHQDENPIKVDQLSSRELQRAGGSNLAASLTKTPGISSVSTGSGIGKPVIRGLSGNRVVVFSQGIRIENQQWGDEHGLGISDDGVEKVEIIKGPASLLYGPDAMGGVINIMDEKPAEIHTVKGDFSTKLSSATMGHQTGVGLKGSGDVFRFNVRGSYANHADYRMGDGVKVTDSRFNERGVKASVGMHKGIMASDLHYTLVNTHLGLPEEIGDQSNSRTPMLPYQTVTTHILSSVNTLYLEKTRIKCNVGYLANDRREFEDGTTPGLHMNLHTLTWDGRLYMNPKQDKYELIVGLQGMSQTNHNSGEEWLIPDAATNDVGVLGLGKWNFDHANIQAGLRFDNRNIRTMHMSDGDPPGGLVNNNYRSANGSIGISWHPGEVWVLRTNLATGFRAPNLAELTSDGVHEGTNRYEVGNRNLMSEQNLQWDASVHLHGKHVTFDLAGFYNHINHYIYIQPTAMWDTANAVYIFQYVQSNANLFGGEFMVDIHPHPFDWLHIENALQLVSGERSDKEALPLIPAPEIRSSLVCNLKALGKLKEPYVSFEVVNTLEQSHVNRLLETTSPGYSLFNVSLGASFKAGKQTLDVDIGVDNLTDKTYIPHLSRLKSEGIFNPGRNFRVAVKIPFAIKRA